MQTSNYSLKKKQNLATLGTALSWFIITLGAFFYMYEYYIRISPGVMIPELMRYFHVNATVIGTLAGFYFYAYTPMQLIVGPLLDKFAPHKLLTMAIIACALGSILTGVAPHGYIVVAYLGRFLQGFGSAFAFIGVMKIGSMILPLNRLALVAGIITSLGFIGAMAGEDSLSLLVRAFSWQHVLIVIGVAGFVLAPIFFLFVRGPKEDEASAQQSAEYGTVKGLWLTLKQPYLWLIGLTGGAMFMPNSVFASLWGIPFLEQSHHLSLTRATFATSLIFLGWAVGSPLQGWLSDHWSQRRHTIIFVNIVIALIVLAAVIAVPSLSYTVLCVLFLVFGILASAEVAIFSMAIEHMPISLSGTALAFVNFLIMLGGLTMQRGVGEILDHEWSGRFAHGIRVYSESNYQHALYVLPFCLAVAAVLIIGAGWLQRKSRA